MDIIQFRRDVIENFYYKIKSDDESINDKEIKITFIDGFFKEAKFDFSGNYTKEQWEILGRINEEIKKLEMITCYQIVQLRMEE